MADYSKGVSALLQRDDLLRKLLAAETADVAALLGVREMADRDLTEDHEIRDADMFPLIRAGLLYALDAIHESHTIVQTVENDTAAYWHGMIHRREGDFENARYWFRRAGSPPAFDELHARASRVSPLFARQRNWDPYLFTGQCEQEKFGACELTEELVILQRVEFDVLFDYVWRSTFGIGKETPA